VEWFDSHCHIHLCEADGSATADAVIDRARESGVTSMLTVGIDVMSSRRNAQIATEFGIWATAGVHPNSASEWDETAALAIESLLSQERVVAVGETGLDFYRDRAPREAQERAFGDHIELAKRTDRALVIHTRDSVDGAMDVLDERGPPERMVFHCWSGGRPQLARALDMGAWISFAGNVSFKSADDLREAARNTPANRLLVETDSPFLAPVPHRGRANEPAFVADVGAAVARARGVQMDEIAASTSENARALFGLK
jgi:TatD DNase family protein